MNKPTRIAWADTGRGIAIVLVTLLHASSWLLAARLDVAYWGSINTVLASLRMPLFFTISGLFAGKWLTVRWVDLFRSKLLLFAWVFAIWGVIGEIFLQLGLIMGNACCGAKTAVLRVIESPVFPQSELWFIWALSIFFIAAHALKVIDWRIQLGVAGAVAFFALSWGDGINVGWSGCAKYFFFFLAGIYLRKWIVAFGATKKRWLLFAAFALWLAVGLTLELAGLEHVIGLYFINCVAGVFGGIALSRALARVSLVGRIGQKTLPIYLAHTPIILVICFVLWLAPVHPIAQAIQPVMPLLVTAAAVSLALLLYRLASRGPTRYLYEPPPWLVRLLGGGKAQYVSRQRGVVVADSSPADNGTSNITEKSDTTDASDSSDR
jgi:uncharacterized membrane protein YcfT